jgi:hypothetical protein
MRAVTPLMLLLGAALAAVAAGQSSSTGSAAVCRLLRIDNCEWPGL